MCELGIFRQDWPGGAALSEPLLRLADLPAMAWRSEENGDRLEFSPLWLDFTGRSFEQEVGAGWMEGLHPDDREVYRETQAEAVRARKPYQIQFRLRRQGGEPCWISESAQPCYDRSGDFAGHVGICSSLSATTAAVSQDILFEFARDALLLIGRGGEILEANRSAESMYGYTREELLKLNILDLRSPECNAEFPAQFSQAWQGGILFETVHRRKDRSRIPVEVSSQSAEIVGRPVLVSSIRDVSERRSMRRELEASESRQRALFETMREGVAIHQLVRGPGGRAVDYVVEEVNPAFSEQTGVARQQVAGRLASTAYGSGAAPYLATYAEVVETGVPVSFETYFEPMKSHFAVSAFSLGEDRFATVFSNISERKKVEDQLRQAQKMEAIGRLAGGVAHDFNNLLTVILGYSDALLDSVPRESPLFDFVVNIKEAGERASRVTAQLLAFGRRQLLRPQVLQLNSVVQEVGKMLKRLIGEDIELVTLLDHDLGRVRADAGQLAQVLLNLAVNSRDAMPRGGKLTVETRNRELDEAYARAHPDVRPGQYVMLAVSDTGTGMDAGTRAHIFEPFFTTKPKGHGTGLGLSTVYGIVKQSGGEIEVYSELGLGTSFKIYLPRVEAQAETGRAVAKAPVASNGEAVLVVEDETPVAELISAVLGNLGYRVLSASSSEEGLRIWREHRTDIRLILSDIVLPGMSGPELVREIEREGGSLPTLYMSGYPNQAVAGHGVDLGGGRFLQKPFTARELAARVRYALDHARKRRRRRT